MVEEHYKSLFAELQKKDAALHEEYSKQQVRLCPLCHGGDYLLEGQSLHCSGECHDVPPRVRVIQQSDVQGGEAAGVPLSVVHSGFEGGV